MVHIEQWIQGGDRREAAVGGAIELHALDFLLISQCIGALSCFQGNSLDIGTALSRE